MAWLKEGKMEKEMKELPYRLRLAAHAAETAEYEDALRIAEEAVRLLRDQLGVTTPTLCDRIRKFGRAA